jgi:threonine dehydratase
LAKTSATIIPKSEIELAKKRISEHLPPTPVLSSAYFSRKFDAQVLLKLENFQPTHSFKVRGALNAILALPEEKRRQGVITASGGNHGLGIALACYKLGISAKIFLPVKTPQVKIEAISALNAEIVLAGQAWDEANQLAQETAKAENRSYIHPFNDPLVMAGQATIVTELLDQVGKVDLIVASIGGGGLISGIISAVKHYSPETRVAGVETRGAHSMYLSVQAGEITSLDSITSIAESLGAKKTEPAPFEIVSQNIDEVVVVDDQAAVHSLLELLQHEKMLVEPATSCSLAAIDQQLIKTNSGEKIAVVMCGANVSLEKVLEWAQKYRQ